jgi:hypothetical protein
VKKEDEDLNVEIVMVRAMLPRDDMPGTDVRGA